MNVLKLNLLAGVCLVGLTVPLVSSAAVITFEGFADQTVFTNQDFGNGVTFSGAMVLSAGGSLNSAQFPPNSGINVVYNPSGAMTLLFTNAVDFFSGYFTYNQLLTITAYDALDNIVDTALGQCTANYIGSGCGAPNEFVQVADAGSISKVIIVGGGGNNFTLDDASFTGSIDPNRVPEPGTLAILLGGLGLLAHNRRRKAVTL